MAKRRTDLQLVPANYGEHTHEVLPNGPACPHCGARFSTLMNQARWPGLRTCLDCYSEFTPPAERKRAGKRKRIAKR